MKKIINADDDVAACSNNAAFAITVATECFIRYLADQTYTVVKSERRPRRNVAYRDVATAVHKHDNLEFLVDVVPKTITYKHWKDKQDHLEKKEKEKEAVDKTTSGQRTLKQMTARRDTKSRQVQLESSADDVNMDDTGLGTHVASKDPPDIEAVQANEHILDSQSIQPTSSHNSMHSVTNVGMEDN